jgi:hypothetical protein
VRFANPIWLYLIPLLPVLWLGWRVADRRARARLQALLGPSADRQVERANPRLRSWRRFLAFCGFFWCMLALAQPQWGAREVAVTQRGSGYRGGPGHQQFHAGRGRSTQSHGKRQGRTESFPESPGKQPGGSGLLCRLGLRAMSADSGLRDRRNFPAHGRPGHALRTGDGHRRRPGNQPRVAGQGPW